MREKISLDDAKSKYVEAIMSSGNPRYFIWQYIKNVSSQDLEIMFLELSKNLDYEIEEDE